MTDDTGGSKLIRALIVDDEPHARKTLRTLLATDEQIEIVGECRTGREAVQAFEVQRPDLVFLDVQMPELDGFGVLASVDCDPLPIVVFVTAYDRYALKAFDVHALDYLVKPFDDERFLAALTRAKSHIAMRRVGEVGQRVMSLLADLQRVSEARTSAPSEARTQLGGDRLVVKSGTRVRFVEPEQVHWIEADDYRVKLHTADGVYSLRESLKRLKDRLDPAKFVRIHRSTIVNLDRVREIEPFFHGEYVVILEDGTKLKMSRSRRRDLEIALGRKL